MSPAEQVPQAFALGWQMAELYNSPVPPANTPSPAAPDPLPTHLPGLSHLRDITIVKLHLDQVDAGVTNILGHSLNEVTAARDALANDRDQFRARIFDLHTALLTALTVDDFRLGKAYGLGRALAETALLPMASDQDRPAVFKEKFGLHRLGNIFRWLADLKTPLPDHAAYAVSKTLHEWAEWVAKAEPERLDTSINPFLRRQSEQWRSLLSGERLAVDLLTANDYVEAGKELSSRLGHTIGAYISHYWKIIVSVLLVILVIVGGIVAATIASGNSKWLWAGLTAVVGAIGGWKGVTATLGKAMKVVEPPLWESELDAAIGNRVLFLPTGPPRTSSLTDDVGLLVADDYSRAPRLAARP